MYIGNSNIIVILKNVKKIDRIFNNFQKGIFPFTYDKDG